MLVNLLQGEVVGSLGTAFVHAHQAAYLMAGDGNLGAFVLANVDASGGELEAFAIIAPVGHVPLPTDIAAQAADGRAIVSGNGESAGDGNILGSCAAAGAPKSHQSAYTGFHAAGIVSIVVNLVLAAEGYTANSGGSGTQIPHQSSGSEQIRIVHASSVFLGNLDCSAGAGDILECGAGVPIIAANQSAYVLVSADGYRLIAAGLHGQAMSPPALQAANQSAYI